MSINRSHSAPAVQQLNTLQCLRAAAAIAVVLYHAAGSTSKYSLSVAKSSAILHFGTAGVDLFFVISGFVMYYTAREGISASEFMRKRVQRIVPIYWLLTAFFAIAASVAAPGSAVALDHVLASFAFVSFADGEMPVVYVGWTLEYEMYFYAVLAASLLVGRAPWVLVTLCLSACVIAGQIAAPVSPAAMFLSRPILIEFLLGILVAQAMTRRRPGALEATAVAATFALVAFRSGDTRFVLTALISTGAVWGAVVAARRGAHVPRLAVLLGDASYSIYLVQVFTLPVCGKLVQRIYPQLPPDLLVVSAAIVTIGAGVLLYVAVEAPVRRWVRSFPARTWGFRQS